MKHYTTRVTRRPNAPTVKGLGIWLESMSEAEFEAAYATLNREVNTFLGDVGRWFQQMGEQGQQVNEEIRSLFRQLTSWSDTFNEWAQDVSVWDQWKGGARDGLVVKREEFAAFLARFRAAGYTGQMPEIHLSDEERARKEHGYSTVSPDELTSGIESASNVVKWLGIAAMAGLGIYGLTLVAPAVKAGAKAGARKLDD